jgi:hypothetical protein
MAICYIFWSFGNFVVIWYIFTRFGTLCQEKSGNPAEEEKREEALDTDNH